MSNLCNIEVNGNGNNIGQLILVNYRSSDISNSIKQARVSACKKSLDSLPDLDQEIVITDHDYQKKLVILIRHLLETGVASISGNYIKGSARTPIFRDKETQQIEVLSIDKKSGQRLLKGQYLSRPNSINKLLKWIIEKFEIVHEMAESVYNTELDKNEQRAHIILGAASFIDYLDKPTEPTSKE